MVRCLFRRLTMFFWGRTLSSVGFVMLVDIFDARLFVPAFTAPRLRLVAELRLQCRFTAFVGFLGALFAECVLGVRLSGHRSPAAPCTAAIRRHCLSGIYSFSPYLVAELRLQCRFTASLICFCRYAIVPMLHHRYFPERMR